MAQTVNTNLASLNAQRSSSRSQSDLTASIARLSSGLRINGAKDDAAGLAIADRFTAKIRGGAQASRNANDGISLAQTAEGALASVSDNLQRIRELAVQSANATNSASDRAALQLEAGQLVAEIDRVARQTQFNGVNLLDGSFVSQAFQVGADAGQTISVSALGNTRSSALGVHQGMSFTAGCDYPLSNDTPRPLTVTIGGGPTVSLGSVAVDAQAVSNAINNAHIPGLTAWAALTYEPNGVSVASASAPGTGVFTLNGVPINLTGATGAANLAANRAAAVAAINAKSASTGFTAIDTGVGVNLLAIDGRNLTGVYSAGSFTGSNLNDFGINNYYSAGTSGSWVGVDYVAPSGVTGNVVFAQVGGLNTSNAIVASGTALANVDISTVAGATLALASVDESLATVSSRRASLGAVQNRFASTIANLHDANSNLSASRSRIQDADFAQETANLSRAQVLQQAGTAMVAQANQAPQQVLQLLR